MRDNAAKAHDYTVFTKQELIAFLLKYENCFLYADTPFNIIISTKMDNIMGQISEVNSEHEKLIPIAATATIEEKILYMSQMHNNNAKWQRLNKEYDRLSDLRFGD